MRFTTREDIDVPIDALFAAISDFQGFERAAMRRGAEVTRTGAAPGSGVGESWTIRFRYRGRSRELVSRIERFEPSAGLTSSGRVGGFEGLLALDLSAQTPKRTRIRVDLDITPKTLTARLLLQSMKLAKSSLTHRFKTRVRTFAQTLERRGSMR